MLKTFMRLLGDDASIFRRYIAMAVLYGICCGLTVATLAPIVSHLLLGELASAAGWLAVLSVGVLVSWLLRKHVDFSGMNVGSSLLLTARQRIGDHVATLPIGWFTPANTARLSHVVSQGVMQVAQLPAHLFTPIISGLVTPLVLVAALCLLQWQMGVLALAALLPIAGIFILSTRLGVQADEAFHQASAQTSQRMVEFAQAQSVLRAFNGENGGTRFLEHAIDRQHQSGKRLIYISTASVVLNSWAVQLTFAALFITAAALLSPMLGNPAAIGSAIGTVIALMLVGRFIDPLLDVAGYAEALRSARGQLDAVNDILAVEPLPETHQAQQPRDGSLDVRHVSFRYAPEQAPVLREISFKAAPGTMTALVGASGSGKTSLIRLLARFFDVTDGAIMLGGADIRRIPATQLTDQISQIFQNTYLFQGSIADNIRLGKPSASEEELMTAVEQAGAAEIIQRLPQGLDTQVGEGGARLSGGERQRIAIARALLKDAPILLVDEATAALDPENQAIIADTLARLRGKKTLIVIAHQLSTIAMADQILVLENGEIAERGTHAQLDALGGRYAHFITQRHRTKGWRIA
ncbi:ABC transporter ATP-binding protein/permease [Serratia nevei]|uniref:ABC transporter ATP-binding protein n=1 Tax=Serratia nevei TaxID=2703794 RepID=UPI0020A06182|nr:ABC transporter ATP-binding protein [Serratia nevei]MCP1107239.1 ABC transporter ATP-binding protein/permease [Serratia nevei]